MTTNQTAIKAAFNALSDVDASLLAALTVHLSPEVKAVRTHEQTWANFEAMLKIIATTGSTELQTCTRAILAELDGELDAEGNLWDISGNKTDMTEVANCDQEEDCELKTISDSETPLSPKFLADMRRFVNSISSTPAFHAEFGDNTPELKTHDDGHLCNCLNKVAVYAHSFVTAKGERMLGYNAIHPEMAKQPKHKIMKHLALTESAKAAGQPYVLECVFLEDRTDTLGLRWTYLDGAQSMSVIRFLKPGRSAPIAWDDKRLMHQMRNLLPANFS